MAANVQLANFPPVFRIKFFQGSGAKPGRLIARTMVLGPANLASLPRLTTLTVNARNFTGVWNDLRVVKVPRVRHGYTNVVLEDDRWKLREARLEQNYNERDSLGNVFSGQKKTISELAQIIASASGLTINAGELPDFEPGAKWADRRASDALDQLLKETGCRFVYDPVLQRYTISHGGTGPMPDVSPRHFRPGPPSTIRQLNVYTRPVLYEDTLDVTAKRINATETEEDTGTNLTIDGTNNKRVTPDAHTPVDADVGRTVRITTNGSGWTAGDYVVAAIQGGDWILDRSPGDAGSTNGEWSLQTGATGETEGLPEPVKLPQTPTEEYGQTRLRLWEPDGIDHPDIGTTGTGMVVDGVDNTKVTPDGVNVSEDDVGKTVKITGGAGWTTGNYRIISQDGTQWTLDSSPAPVTTVNGEWSLAYSPDGVLLFDHRAKTHLFDPENPTHERARIVRDDWNPYPHHQPLYAPQGATVKLIELTGGGRAFLTDHPVLMTDSTGKLLTTCKLVASYYVRDASGLKREKKEWFVDDTAPDEIDITIDWLKPVDSTLPDMATDVWDQVHQKVAEAIGYPLSHPGDDRKPQSIELSTPLDLQGSGKVGGVFYEFTSVRMGARIKFQVALNFTPGQQGAIH